MTVRTYYTHNVLHPCRGSSSAPGERAQMTAILGISAFYHDSAAALLIDGEIAGAAQEERFSRRKHDASFPRQAVDFCLAQAGIAADDVDYCVFYDKPLT